MTSDTGTEHDAPDDTVVDDTAAAPRKRPRPRPATGTDRAGSDAKASDAKTGDGTADGAGSDGTVSTAKADRSSKRDGGRRGASRGGKPARKDGKRPRRAGVLVRVLIVALAIELVAALGVVGVLGATTVMDWQESRERAAAVDAARTTVGALMAISPSTIDEHFAIVEEGSTGAFAEQFAKTADTIRETVMTYATEQSAEVLRAAYAGGDSDSAVILLAVDTTTVHKTPVGGDDPENDGEKKDGNEEPSGPIDSHYRVKAHMALVDGVWLLAELEMST